MMAVSEAWVGTRGKVRSCPPVVTCRRHFRPAFGGGRRGRPGAIAADNATTTYFESINYWTLAACISYTEEVS